MFLAADQSGWCLLKVGAVVAMSSNKTAMKFASSMESSLHEQYLYSDSMCSTFASALTTVDLLLTNYRNDP